MLNKGSARRSRNDAILQISSVQNWIAGVTNNPPSQPLLSEEQQSELLRGTSLEGQDLTCVYKASRNGWSAIDFHNCVDNKGSALVVSLTRSGQVFGGFNPVGWRSSDDYYNSNSAFLWFLAGNRAKKCDILPGGNAAIFDYATGGPCFGAADLLIGEPRAAVMGGFAGPDTEDMTSSAGNLRAGKCSPGGSYSFEGAWPVRGNFQLVDVEIFTNTKFASESSASGGGPSWWPF